MRLVFENGPIARKCAACELRNRMGVTYRLTAKVAKKLKPPPAPSTTASTGLLGDFYVHLINMGRQPLLLVVSEKTLLPLVLPARDLRSFPQRVVQELAGTLQHFGIPPDAIEKELEAMSSFDFAPTASRTVLGSMNDFARLIPFYLSDGDSLVEAGYQLSNAPCSPLGMDSPRQATEKLFGVTMTHGSGTSGLPPC